MIEQAEYVLRDLGFYDVRVRHHELKSEVQSPKSEVQSPKSEVVRHLARIEVGPKEMNKLMENGMAARVAEGLRGIGYAHVTLDLLGYRRGSGNPASATPVALAEARASGAGETFAADRLSN